MSDRSFSVVKLATTRPNQKIRVDVDHLPARGFYVSLLCITIERCGGIDMEVHSLYDSAFVTLEPSKRFSRKTMDVWGNCLRIFLAGGTPVVDKPEMLGKLKMVKDAIEALAKQRNVTLAPLSGGEVTPPVAPPVQVSPEVVVATSG